MVASMAGQTIGPVWGLFGRRYRLRITMADDRKRFIRT